MPDAHEPWPPEDIDLNDPRWLTPKEAAHIARVDEKTIRRWAREFDVAIWTPAGRCWIDRRRLFRPQPPEMSGHVRSPAPLRPGIVEAE
ncbi:MULTISPECIES: helix-turn-helix domain-containing protein [unclassified Chelatococcus]|uniref:helix-turn-helix domain-containing protein n=1 Tax=unclassified Chelatococcus TaxID=2638111 RepID=UPI0003759355|nr:MULTISPECIES: helix-turn-helix domain-containing protein [unclassified Chelatococcus]ALA17183.1 hypothetical protein AL346_06900 [Chelatococcus sp. CO-6]